MGKKWWMLDARGVSAICDDNIVGINSACISPAIHDWHA